MRVTALTLSLIIAIGAADAALLGEPIVRVEWAKADNRSACAPLGFDRPADRGGKPRSARFAGGWAVAFDLPNRRSAYGLAGTGLLPQDSVSFAVQRAALHEQWPYTRSIRTLPRQAFAGFGLSGARRYPASNPQGRGLESLAYVRIDGQRCLYNVWSRLGRTHLETLLAALRPITISPSTGNR